MMSHVSDGRKLIGDNPKDKFRNHYIEPISGYDRQAFLVRDGALTYFETKENKATMVNSCVELFLQKNDCYTECFCSLCTWRQEEQQCIAWDHVQVEQDPELTASERVGEMTDYILG